MARIVRLLGAVVAVSAVACGTAAVPSSPAPKLASAPAVEASDATSVTSTLAAKIEAKDDSVEESPVAIPESCAGEGAVKDLKTCLPPQEFAKKLCGDIYPEVSLGLFAKGTPWTRVWLAGDVDAWNASGGRSQRTKLAFDEEVIVLSKHAPNAASGIVMVGAAASYDVVRADGTCFTVMDGEITTKKPPQPKLAPPPWSRLEENTRRALLASSPKVKSSFEAFGKACAGDVTKACERAERVFAQNVADAVRGGAVSLPVPARRP